MVTKLSLADYLSLETGTEGRCEFIVAAPLRRICPPPAGGGSGVAR
jgi:hypothetical protein